MKTKYFLTKTFIDFENRLKSHKNLISFFFASPYIYDTCTSASFVQNPSNHSEDMMQKAQWLSW